jgi:integrase
MHLLTTDRVAELIKGNVVGRYGDGGNLALDIPGGNRAPAWIVRYKSPSSGKERMYKIGNQTDYTLTAARKRAAEIRQQLDDDIDPLEARQANRQQATADRRAAQKAQEAVGATLKAETEALHALMVDAKKFKTTKAERQWLSRIENNVPADIWLKPISDITEDDIRGFMEPLWARKYPTAKKLRQRLEAVFHRARKYAPLNIPAVIKRDLHVVKSTHTEIPHRSLPYKEVPRFVAALRKRPGTSARMLEFAILTAARTNEVRGLEWPDIRGNVWRVPGHKMKGEDEHVVQLSKRALAILGEVRGLDPRIVFPSEARPHTPASNMAMLNLIGRMGYGEKTTAHGICRGSFSAWAYSQQRWSEDVIESCLAHKEADRVKRAYSEGKNLETHKAECWASWAEFIDPRGGKQRSRVRSVA